jgi:RHS repeat-associated protein
MGIHSKTPTLAVNDSRGLAILTVNYWRADASVPSESRIERTLRDPAGRAVKQWDARLWALQADDPDTPASVVSVYALNDSVLRSVSTDAGGSLQLQGLAGEQLLGWDSRLTRREVEYDDLLRPLAVFEEGTGVPRRCAERFAYGSPDVGDPLHNQLGQLIRHDDPAGSVLFEQFSITGQCSKNTRHFTVEPVAPDWPQAVIDRHNLLENGAGASTQWRFAPHEAVLEQIDAGGHRQTFALTLDGRLRAIDLQLGHQNEGYPVVHDIRYNAQGQVTQELAGNGVLTTLGYRAEDGRLSSRHAQDRLGNVLQHSLYDYDPVGNVTRIEDKALPVRWFANQRIEPVSLYRYDSLSQLRQASGWEAGIAGGGPTAVANYTQSYRYDAGGNLLELTHVGAQSPGHQLQAARYSNRCLPWRNGVPPDEAEIGAAFDARGNLLLLDQGRQLQWNLRNQLDSVVAVQRESRVDDRESYLYDGAGQRVRKTRLSLASARSLLTDVRYLPGLEMRADTGTGERLQVIIVETGLNSVRVLHWESPPPTGINDLYRYSFSDHLGSISLELDADGQLISREHFYPFGATAWADEPDVSYKTVRYSGKERDATGLYYYGYRYYMPWLQRWLNPDPKGFVDGANLFQMVGNSPIRYLDSDGGGREDTSALTQSAQKQSQLLGSMSSVAADVRNSLLNHTQPRHRFRALARRVVTQLASHVVRAGAEAIGGAAGGGLGGTFGPAGGVLGAKLGTAAGGKLADAAISAVVDTYQLNRPINFTGREMNPKAFVESVEPKKQRSLAQAKLELFAHDPRTSEGRSRLVAMARIKAEEKLLSIAEDKLGSQTPGLIQTGREFALAAQGLNAEALSQTWEDIPVNIDMATFRTQAIVTELATSGVADPELFEKVSELSFQTSSTVLALERTQDFIGLVAPKPYAGRAHSLGQRTGPILKRQKTVGG